MAFSTSTSGGHHRASAGLEWQSRRPPGRCGRFGRPCVATRSHRSLRERLHDGDGLHLALERTLPGFLQTKLQNMRDATRQRLATPDVTKRPATRDSRARIPPLRHGWRNTLRDSRPLCTPCAVREPTPDYPCTLQRRSASIVTTSDYSCASVLASWEVTSAICSRNLALCVGVFSLIAMTAKSGTHVVLGYPRGALSVLRTRSPSEQGEVVVAAVDYRQHAHAGPRAIASLGTGLLPEYENISLTG